MVRMSIILMICNCFGQMQAGDHFPNAEQKKWMITNHVSRYPTVANKKTFTMAFNIQCNASKVEKNNEHVVVDNSDDGWELVTHPMLNSLVLFEEEKREQ